MSEPSQPNGLLPMELPSMSSAEGSPARTCPSQGAGPAFAARGRASGLKSFGSFAIFDLLSSSWKTSQRSLVEGLELFSETWPRSGTMRNGIAFLLEPLAPLTFGTASGLWPTPTVLMTGEHRTLEQFEAARSRALVKQKGRSGNGIGEDLAIAVKRRALWPTPIKRDGRTFLGAKRSPNAVGSEPLVIQVGGNLNPPWVAWLMGFPLDWLDGVSPPSKRSETPSSRKSRS
jgi:hypothetical protein